MIPTIGRPTLNRAIRSALDQEHAETEVIVAWDGPSTSTDLRTLHEDWGHRIKVVHTGHRGRGSVGRQIGTEAGSADWVAYLDDDDFWFPTKLRRQFQAISSDRDVLSCRVRPVAASSGLAACPAPRDVYDRSEPLEEWLFRRRRLSGQRNHIHTSTLLLARSLASSVGWVSDPRRHEDWGFVLRAVRDHEARIVQLPATLVAISVGSKRSVSSRDDWRDSLKWMDLHASGWDRSVAADFLVGQPLRYALQARDWTGAREVIERLRDHGLPSARAWALALSGLLEREHVERLMLITGRGGSPESDVRR